MLSDVRAILLQFSAQLRLTPLLVAQAGLASVGAGVIFHFLRSAWFVLIPLTVLLLSRYYLPVHEVPLSDRVDGTYRSLRAAGLSRECYLTASAVLYVSTLLVLVAPAFLTIATLSDGWRGFWRFCVYTTMLVPLTAGLFYFSTARIVEAPDVQAAEVRAKYGPFLVILILFAPLQIVTLLAPQLVGELWRDLGALIASYWPLLTAALWAPILAWLLWLGRGSHPR